MKGEAMRKVSMILVIGLLVLSLFSGAVSGDIAVPSLRGAYTNVTADEAKGMIEANLNIILLDVRMTGDFPSGHLSGARCVPLSELKERIEELDKDRDLIVYCNSGTKSKPACEILAENGFKNVYNMLGGIKAWTAAGFAVTTPSLPSYTSSEKNSVDSMINSAFESNKSAFLFFYADWCHFSQQQKPIIDALEQEYSDKIAFIRVNADDNTHAVNEFGVTGFPAIFLIVDKKEEGYVYQQFDGFTDKEVLKECFGFVIANGSLLASPGISSFHSDQKEMGNLSIVIQENLTLAEFDAELANDIEFKELHDYAAELGYVYPSRITKTTYDNGVTITAAMMISDDLNQFIFLTKVCSNETNTSLMIQFDNTNITIFNKDGGTTIHSDGAISSYGAHHSCSLWKCYKNCIVEKFELENSLWLATG